MQRSGGSVALRTFAMGRKAHEWLNFTCVLALFFVGAIVAGAQPAPLPPEETVTPITAAGRVNWWLRSTAGPASIAASSITSATNTGLNLPDEYGPHWGGFGKRVGIRLADKAVMNAMEAAIGSVWGEDPRYFRA